MPVTTRMEPPRAHSEDDEHSAGLYVLDMLGAPERDAFERHLAQCQLCQQLVVQDRSVLERLNESAVERDPGPELKSQIWSQIARDLAAPTPDSERTASSSNRLLIGRRALLAP